MLTPDKNQTELFRWGSYLEAAYHVVPIWAIWPGSRAPGGASRRPRWYVHIHGISDGGSDEAGQKDGLMTWAGRTAAVGAAAAMFLGLNEVPEWPVSLVTVGVTVAFGWWLTSGFWRNVALGAAGGTLAGLVILGPGWRVVMRVVAIMDPFTSPEFSLGGTMLIIIVIGALAGGVMGIVGNLLRHVAGIRSAFVSGIALGLVLPGMLLVHLRNELTDLGGGVWVNLIMFGTVSILYGIVAMNVTDRLAARTTRVMNTTRDNVPA